MDSEKYKLEKVKERARMTLSVIAQLPVEADKDALNAANLVYKYCKKSACKTEEEKEAWDDVFHHCMPMDEGTASFFASLLMAKPSEA